MTSFAISVPVGAWHPVLPETLESLASQGADVQIALLDASEDPRVKALAEKYCERLAHVRHGPDLGQSDAILEGWAAVGGDVLGWLNADDVLAPDALAKVKQTLVARDAPDVVTGHSVVSDENLRLTGYHWAVEPPTDKILRECTISQPSTFFRRSAHDHVGGLRRELQYTMDWDLWIRFWREGCRFAFVDDVLSRVLWGADTKTGQFNRARRAELDRLISANQSVRARFNSRLGFAVHHFLEKPLFRRFAPVVRGRMAPHLQPISGLGADGEVFQRAEIPVFHFRREPAVSIRLELEAPAAQSLVFEFGTESFTLPRGEEVAEFHLANPLPANETREAVMFVPNTDGVRLACLELLFEASVGNE